MLLAEAKSRGLEALLTFRVNDAHGNDFLRTAFWREHPEFRLGKGALDFAHEEVREYVFRLIEEAVRRYDCDGIELDFQRFPTFFKDGTTEERVAKINGLVARVREMLDAEGKKRGRRLVLAARVPSDYGRTAPSYETARALGCDPVAWARKRLGRFPDRLRVPLRAVRPADQALEAAHPRRARSTAASSAPRGASASNA